VSYLQLKVAASICSCSEYFAPSAMKGLRLADLIRAKNIKREGERERRRAQTSKHIKVF